jgi:hypothetical protein
MAGYCLPQEFATKFLNALRDGKIDPDKLIDMTSAERRAYLEDIVGKENVRDVNALLESKLLLKDQKRGLVTWAKKISGISEPARTDLLSKIERMDKFLDADSADAFLEDLAAKRFGADVSFEQSQKIVEGAKDVKTAREAIPEGSPQGSDERLSYGLKFVEFQKYVNELKASGDVPTWKEWLTSPTEMFNTIAGTAKSALSSFDNSFFGRQGIKMFFSQPDIWAKDFAKSWGDIGRELVKTKSSVEPMDIIKADIYSRENAINGKYDTAGIDLGLSTEEAFPSPLPGKLPILGRLFNASETAFNGAALRMRADYGDRILKKAEEFGIDTSDKDQSQGLGKLINAMTGRGYIGKVSTIGKEVNAGFFSIRFAKSNFDTLTMHRLGFAVEKGLGRDFVRREAAMNTLKMVAGMAAIMTTANLLQPGSAELDPRSANFGKIKIGQHTFDLTGGMGSFATLAARLVPTMHKGKLSFWYKSRNGVYTDLVADKYGQQNAMDILNGFWEGKLSPVASIARDLWSGRTYQGTKPSALNETTGLFTPLPIQTFEQLHEPEAGTALGFMILEELGLSVNTDQASQKKAVRTK